MRNLSIYRRLLLLAAAALAGMAMAAGTAQAQRPTVAQQFQHYLECLDWMFNDPARHATECAPGHVYIIPDPKSSGSSKPDCPEYVQSGYLPVGRYDDCYEPPCNDDVGYVPSTFGGGDCNEPCAERSAYLLTGVGYDDCYEPPCGGDTGSLTTLPVPKAWFLAVQEGGCPTTAPLVYEDLRLFAI